MAFAVNATLLSCREIRMHQALPDEPVRTDRLAALVTHTRVGPVATRRRTLTPPALTPPRHGRVGDLTCMAKSPLHSSRPMRSASANRKGKTPVTTDLERPAAATDSEDPFAVLTKELADLDYTGGEVIDGIVTYDHADNSDVRATIDHARQEVRLSHRNDDGDPTWTLRFTADTPPEVQIITLYLALHAGVGDRDALVRSVADALKVSLGAV
ncbi:hypothetical protein [Virgisporangium aurantiacum]|uniref:Uncharacterized protein n=1 Tax=Virgisporangium aurantiacum TaxID=175570 RepID=A0A8J4E763_9ACTN|nr:hypothetical protein [Virgisporangium aurantiacum]GIJ64795.1 hypothetical protein Vau01_123110 [Virgisporangium aurantiacum]